MFFVEQPQADTIGRSGCWAYVSSVEDKNGMCAVW